MATDTGPDQLTPEERKAILRQRLEDEKSRRHIAEAALSICMTALRRLSLIDEMAGMGQQDDDPELISRCRYAKHHLEQAGNLISS